MLHDQYSVCEVPLKTRNGRVSCATRGVFASSTTITRKDLESDSVNMPSPPSSSMRCGQEPPSSLTCKKYFGYSSRTSPSACPSYAGS